MLNNKEQVHSLLYGEGIKIHIAEQISNYESFFIMGIMDLIAEGAYNSTNKDTSLYFTKNN